MDVYHVRPGSILPLGKQGENLVRQIQFDLSRWISNFGPGTVQLLHQRSGDETPYPVAVEQEGNLAVWTVTSADTAAAGTGRAELQYYVGDALAKSETWMTKVSPALGDASETPPEAQQGWVDQVLAQVARITGMTAQAVELPAGSAPTADYADGVLTIGIPLGGDVSEAQIAQAVAEYLSKNPIAETDPTVPDWAKQTEKPSYTADEVGADPSGTAASKVSAHNTGTDTHSDIRLLIQGLTERLNTLADSDDTTLDQLSEIVAYIKSNRDLIAAVTTDKVGVTDIVNDLVTNVANKPLSAAQGVALKALADALSEEIANLGGGLLTVETITIGEGTGETVAVTGLTLDLSTYSATVGDSFYINPVVAPSNATNKAVTWKSSAASIATVDGNGYVECVADGDAVITCTTVDGGFTATCAVSIAAAESGGGTEVTMTGISATYSGGDVAVGTSVTDLTGIVVTATYSDGSTATVTDYTLSGTIAEGSNTITVSYGGKATTFTVMGVADSTGGKVQLSTLEMTDGLFKADGTIVSIGSTYHVQIPYTEGMFISTGTNAGWNQTTYPAMVVLDNGEYTIPGYTAHDGIITVGGKTVSQITCTLMGYSETAIVYVSFLAGGTKGPDLETNMDKADIYYYIPGGEA